MTTPPKPLTEKEPSVADLESALGTVELLLKTDNLRSLKTLRAGIAEIKRLRAGPNEKEKAWLLETIEGCEGAIKLRQKIRIPSGSGENIQTFKRLLETAMKLKKAWGMP